MTWTPARRHSSSVLMTCEGRAGAGAVAPAGRYRTVDQRSPMATGTHAKPTYQPEERGLSVGHQQGPNLAVSSAKG